MASNMETSSKWILAFLNDVISKLESAKAENIRFWRALESTDLNTLMEADDGRVYDWDRPSYSAEFVAEGAAADVGNTITEYFELYETIRRVLSVYEQTLGLDFIGVIDDHLVTLAIGRRKQDLFCTKMYGSLRFVMKPRLPLAMLMAADRQRSWINNG